MTGLSSAGIENFPENDRAAWIKGPSTNCSQPPEQVSHPWRLVLLGPPGVGKGTQSELLAERLGACHLSTGDVFRAVADRSDSSPAMAAAQDFMRHGQLVPDAIVWEMVKERVGCLRCHCGFLLDGFPRTVGQAEMLQQLLAKERLPLDAVLDYELPSEEIIFRLSGRRTCEGCKSVFHVSSSPPRTEAICNHCGGLLVQREDDRPEAIAVRLADYARTAAPLRDFYRQKGLLTTVSAAGSPEEILQRTRIAFWETTLSLQARTSVK